MIMDEAETVCPQISPWHSEANKFEGSLATYSALVVRLTLVIHNRTIQVVVQEGRNPEGAILAEFEFERLEDAKAAYETLVRCTELRENYRHTMLMC